MFSFAKVLIFSPEAATVQWFISERDADKPVPCHVYLWNNQQKPIQIPGLPFWKNHFATHGEFEIELPTGVTPLKFIGAGYRRIQGSMEVGDEHDMMRQHHRLERLVDLARRDGFQANCTFIGLWGGALAHSGV